MSPEEKAAKISRADKFALKLQNAANEDEIRLIIEDILYALISRLEWEDRVFFNRLLKEANYVVKFDDHKGALISILDAYKEFIKGQ